MFSLKKAASTAALQSLPSQPTSDTCHLERVSRTSPLTVLLIRSASAPLLDPLYTQAEVDVDTAATPLSPDDGAVESSPDGDVFDIVAAMNPAPPEGRFAPKVDFRRSLLYSRDLSAFVCAVPRATGDHGFVGGTDGPKECGVVVTEETAAHHFKSCHALRGWPFDACLFCGYAVPGMAEFLDHTRSAHCRDHPQHAVAAYVAATTAAFPQLYSEHGHQPDGLLEDLVRKTVCPYRGPLPSAKDYAAARQRAPQAHGGIARPLAGHATKTRWHCRACSTDPFWAEMGLGIHMHRAHAGGTVDSVRMETTQVVSVEGSGPTTVSTGPLESVSVVDFAHILRLTREAAGAIDDAAGSDQVDAAADNDGSAVGAEDDGGVAPTGAETPPKSTTGNAPGSVGSEVRRSRRQAKAGMRYEVRGFFCDENIIFVYEIGG